MVLAAGELAALQAAAASLLDKTADITRNPNIGSPVKGSIVDAWDSVASGVACGMRQPSASEAARYADLIASKEVTVISFPDGQDVQRFDRVVIDGTAWVVAAPMTPQSYSTLAQVLATRMV